MTRRTNKKAGHRARAEPQKNAQNARKQFFWSSIKKSASYYSTCSDEKECHGFCLAERTAAPVSSVCVVFWFRRTLLRFKPARRLTDDALYNALLLHSHYTLAATEDITYSLFYRGFSHSPHLVLVVSSESHAFGNYTGDSRAL